MPTDIPTTALVERPFEDDGDSVALEEVGSVVLVVLVDIDVLVLIELSAVVLEADVVVAELAAIVVLALMPELELEPVLAVETTPVTTDSVATSCTSPVGAREAYAVCSAYRRKRSTPELQHPSLCWQQ